MASRDKTKQFIQIRANNDDSSVNNPILLQQSQVSQTNQLMQSISHTYQTISSKINLLPSQLTDLQKLQQKRLRVNFENDELLQDKEIHQFTMNLNQQLNVLSQECQQMSIFAKNPNISDCNKKIIIQMQLQLITRINAFNQTYIAHQNNYTKKLTNEAVLIDIYFDASDKQGMSLSPFNTFFNSNLTQQQQQEEQEEQQQLHREIDERGKEIKHVVESIEQLSSLFNELSKLVVIQGTILDTIDANISNANDHMFTSIQELDKAEKYQQQSSSIPNRCILLLMVLIFLMIGMLIIKSIYF